MRRMSRQDKRTMKYVAAGIAGYIAVFVAIVLLIGVEHFERFPIPVLLGFGNLAAFMMIAACAEGLAKKKSR